MENPERDLARQIIENTNTNLFLTGRAGTGKTTFLRQIREEVHKRMVVLAPTGIAAINAGGVTIHSFLQLPFAPFIPGMQFRTDQFRMPDRKRRLIRSLDLIVIDEISMVRADLLDSVDAALRRYRDPTRPFGGVQLLLIGDLQQLSPVVKDEDRELLSRYYDSEYFFSSHALRQTPFVTVELQTVYRQSDDTFLRLLNAVRSNRLDAAMLAQLNARYVPHFRPPEGEAYVRLVTHNHQADSINRAEMTALTTPAFTYDAEVKDKFPESSYPAADRLVLKRGAQVMFIRNGMAGDDHYFNGMLGEVVSLDRDEITVRTNEGGVLINVPRETWNNARYVLNERTNEIEEVVDGTFTQYPLRPAWAITVHKSQGLTFERAIIDVQGAFAHGQAYVALSRCKSLEGLVLSAPIPASAIIQDGTVLQFTEHIPEQQPTPDQLQQMRRNYFFALVCDLFSFADLERRNAAMQRLLEEFFYKKAPITLEDFRKLLILFRQQIAAVAVKFRPQYETLIATHADYATHPELLERITKGAAYFADRLGAFEGFMRTLSLPAGGKEVAKRAKTVIDELRRDLYVKLRVLRYFAKHPFDVNDYQRLHSLATIEDPTGPMPTGLATTARKTPAESASASTSRTKKTGAPRETMEEKRADALRQLEAGKSVREIAAARGVTEQTVSNYLLPALLTGRIELDDLYPADHVRRVRHYLRDHDHSRDDDTPVSLTAIREAVGGDISFDTIRTVRAVVRAVVRAER